jgi:hypothetical protein
MPCTDGGVPYGPTREEVLDSKAPAMLCGLIGALEKSDFLDALDRIDWKEAGVSRAEFNAWWKQHREQDEDRRVREAEKAIKEKAKKEALAKLTPEERKALGV